MCSTIRTGGPINLKDYATVEKPVKHEPKPEAATANKAPELQTKESVQVNKQSLGKAVSKIYLADPDEKKYDGSTTRNLGIGGNIAVQRLVTGKLNPVGSTIGGIFFAAYDLADAQKKTNDYKVGKAAAAMAWATVGLDVVSVAAGLSSGKFISRPVAFAIEAATIGTSMLSDGMANQSVQEANKRQNRLALEPDADPFKKH